MENRKSKIRIIIVFLFIIIFAIGNFIHLRGTYLQYKELGENYIQVFFTNLKYKYIIFGVNFAILYVSIYFTNRGIKKGLNIFFNKENKQIPKLLNKSIALVGAIIISSVMSSIFVEKILLCMSNASFIVTDKIFNLDIAYYMFQKPLIETILKYFALIILGLTLYMIIYYIIVFNRHFDGIDSKMLKESLLIKKILRNVLLIVITIAILTALNTTNILTSNMLTIKDQSNSLESIEIIGAGYTEVTIQRWGYLIFSIIMIIAIINAIRAFKKGNNPKAIKNLLVIPIYLIGLFLVMVVFDLIFVNSNTLDKQKTYLSYNIEGTKQAYNIDIEEINLQNSGTIKEQEVKQNRNIIENIRVINEDTVLSTLREKQTGTGYYSYRNANIAKYNINGKERLMYISPREISNSGRTYNSKTYEYTHGIGQIIVDASTITDTGTLEYIQKDVTGKDEQIITNKKEIYFGLETNDTIATNTKNKKEYDYTDENGLEFTSTYQGKAGLTLNFLDRLVLAIKTGNLNLVFSTEITSESKILTNRNIIKRAKQVLPYLIYDENPYTVVTQDGKIVWVLDAYTISNKYPYSQYTVIQHDGIKEKINYIRNSVKVIIDAYDGTMKFYVTDTTDPIAMAYRNVYPTLFESNDDGNPAEIQKDITQHFIYPKYLYKVQAEMLKTYHNVKPDVLYRTDDLWDFAKYNSTTISKSTGNYLKPYYTMVDDENTEKIGLIQIYTPSSKQNMISYLVGTAEENTNKLKLYKFSEDSNILGPMQLDNQIQQDETISAEIESLSTIGTKVTKDIVAIPINNTILYVESIYQTRTNQDNIPVLKKIVVSSGNKVAIGNNLEQALDNLLSTDALDIEVENTENIDGLIDAIIKANKNLLESTNNNDWELMGSDIEKLQNLINTLERLKLQEDEKKIEQDKINNTIMDFKNNIVE